MRRLVRLFQPSTLRRDAHRAYVGIVRQSRQPELYRELGIPDTPEGRFEALCLHLFLAMHRLQHEAGEETHRLARYIMEAFVHDMDRTLRETGIGDTGVGRRVKRAAAAMFARIAAYRAAVSDRQAFSTLLKDYVYSGLTRDPAALAQYAYAQLHGAGAIPLATAATGVIGEL
ncbi:MAG: ubiquinol-cytochrome C chaperone [Alphaproteobacteria bacterium]|nr:ubiquinol-cytochrome C chaperone [Alphaproteobacteria bacterium]